MSPSPLPRTRRRIVPEVIQTSAMDCGPAALKSLLEGFGVDASYGRLREACQTGVDGTSINTVEDIAVQLGLDAHQTVVALEHLLLHEVPMLPALVVMRQPHGAPHFVVVWSVLGRFVQVMDPAVGRRWVSRERFLANVYIHAVPVPASTWRDWAEGDEFCTMLRARARKLGINPRMVNRAIEDAVANPEWVGFGRLDACLRMLQALRESGGIQRGQRATRLFEAALAESGDGHLHDAIPQSFWSVRPLDGSEDDPHVLLRGAVLVRIRGAERVARSLPRAPDETTRSEGTATSLSPELITALEEVPVSPTRTLLAMLGRGGWGLPVAVLGLLLMSSLGTLAQSLLMRGLVDAGTTLGLFSDRLTFVGALIVLTSALAFMELPIASGVQYLGRSLEIRFRVALLEKLPLLHDRYFHSRTLADMAERGHSIHAIRGFTAVAKQLVATTFNLGLTVGMLCWFAPSCAVVVICVAALLVALPFALQGVLTERDLRVRTHASSLGRTYLDALLGILPVRSHGAARALRAEHERLLVAWRRAGMDRQNAVVLTDAVISFAGLATAAWLVLRALEQRAAVGTGLLLAYWALNLPAMGQDLALALRTYPMQRNLALRLLEVLRSPDVSSGTRNLSRQTQSPRYGVSIDLDDVSVVVAGNPVLKKVTLRIQSGTHVGIVGASGAGKSTLVGLLLGWHRLAAGQVRIDGELLDSVRLELLRAQTAWVDPEVRLWNASFIENVRYGVDSADEDAIASAVVSADLRPVVERLPDGMATRLGEGGALVSGGEGQRVRFARALLKSDARLVVLDEAFRGLDRAQRKSLLTRARAHFGGATILCVTHDIEETLGMDRVLVIDGGAVVEDGAPGELLCKGGSRFRALYTAERSAHDIFHERSYWRRLRVERGHVMDTSP